MELKQVYSNISLFHNNEKYVRETAEQIILDFERFGIEIHFPENLHYAYSELYDQLFPEIAQLLESNHGKLMAMLYAIDVSEKLIKKEAYSHPEKNLADIVTHLTLDREFKKVLTRNYFKDQENFNNL